MFTFVKNHQISKVFAPFCVSNSDEWVPLLLTHHSRYLVWSIFQILVILKTVFWYLIAVLICISLMMWCEASFHMFTSYLYIFFDEVSVEIFIPFLQLDFWSYWVLRILCVFLDNSSFWYLSFSNIFPPCVACLIILLILSFVDLKF